MRPTPPYEPPGCPEEIRERIEPFLDDELDPNETERVEAHLEGCALCSAELDEARRVRDALRELPLVDCPQRVVESVLSTAAEERPSSEPLPSEPLRPRGGWTRTGAKPGASLSARSESLSSRPPRTRSPRTQSPRTQGLWLVAATVLFALIGVGLLWDRTSRVPAQRLSVARSEPTVELTAAELAQAEQDARIALALFAQVSDRVGRIVQEEVIGRRVSAAPSLALDVIRERTENREPGVYQ